MTEERAARHVVGVNPTTELLSSGCPVDRLYVEEHRSGPQIRRLTAIAKDRGIPVIHTTKAYLDRVSEGAVHQGVAAVAAEKEYCSVDDILQYAAQRGEPPFLLILSEIMDPHNLGAIIRSAEGCGAHGIIVPARRSAPLSSVVAKTSAGALEHMRIARVTNLAAAIDGLKKSGVWVYGAADGSAALYTDTDLRGPLALVIGNEGAGIGKLVREKCDGLVRIPMVGSVSSLNASVAAGVLLYEALRQRNLRT